MEKTEDCGGNPCYEQLKSIYEYLDGALSAEEIAQLQEHLDNCAHCAEAKNLEELVRAKIKSSCAQQAPEALKTKLMGYIDEFCATA